MPRGVKAKEPKRFLPLPAGVEVGKLVRYYSKGWYTGTLEEVKGNDAGIRPIGYLNKNKHLKWVNISDLEAIGE